jgi:hypothetical protein
MIRSEETKTHLRILLECCLFNDDKQPPENCTVIGHGAVMR